MSMEPQEIVLIRAYDILYLNTAIVYPQVVKLVVRLPDTLKKVLGVKFLVINIGKNFNIRSYHQHVKWHKILNRNVVGYYKYWEAGLSLIKEHKTRNQIKFVLCVNLK